MSHKIQLAMSILTSLWEHECWEQTFQNSQTMIDSPLNKQRHCLSFSPLFALIKHHKQKQPGGRGKGLFSLMILRNQAREKLGQEPKTETRMQKLKKRSHGVMLLMGLLPLAYSIFFLIYPTRTTYLQVVTPAMIQPFPH